MDNINIELNGRRILIELDKPVTILKSGIIIPDSVVEAEKPTIGIIRKISTDIDETELHIGDKVVFKRNTCTDININEKPYALVLIESIMAKLEENEQ